MGSYISPGARVEIAETSYSFGPFDVIGWREIDVATFRQIVSNPKIHTIQIENPLCSGGYEVIDRLLAARPDLIFRIFYIGINDPFDFAFLKELPNLKKLRLEGWLVSHPDAIDPRILCELPQLTALHLNLFDLHDYSFIQNLPPSLTDLQLFADTMSGAIRFDCQWLLRLTALHTLYLGKKAKKHLECLTGLPRLCSLTLRGIKPADFSFLAQIPLESFHLLWCGATDLSALGNLQTLRELELWRILKLTDIDFISRLTHLERLELQDLRHITTLPDLSRLIRLREIVLDNVPIDRSALPPSIQALIHT